MNLKIGTIRGHWAAGACPTIDCSNRLDLRSETELQIQVKKHQFDNAVLSKVIDDKKLWFTWMDMLASIHIQFFFNANSLVRQLITSHFCRSLALQALALVTAAIHCARSGYATGKKVMAMFSQDEFRGKICFSTLIDCITAEATALINYTWWADSYPLPQWCSLVIIGAPQSPSALLSLDWGFDHSALHTDLSVSAPPLELALLNPILNFD